MTAGAVQIINADAVHGLRSLASGSVQTVVTSPPYWALRDYGVAGQLGREPSPEEYVTAMVKVFGEVWRVLRDDGTLWLNLGDTYTSTGGHTDTLCNKRRGRGMAIGERPDHIRRDLRPRGVKPKDLVGIPWRMAFALQEAGWYLRQDIIWHKPNPMPEAVRDRCTKAHEYLFLLSKLPRYYFDSKAIKEPVSGTAQSRGKGLGPKSNGPNSRMVFNRTLRPNMPKPSMWNVRANASFSAAVRGLVTERNKRSVWSVGSRPYKGAHFATFPAELIRPCIRAGCPVGGVVLDPFAGSGTTGAVAIEEGRSAILIELNPAYLPLIEERCAKAKNAAKK